MKVHGKGPVAQWALLHDAHESIIGDISAPIKAAVAQFTPELDRYERDLQRVFCQRFMGTESPPQAIIDAVKLIDRTILMWEAEQIMKDPPQRWGVPVEDMYWPTAKVTCWGPSVAAQTFLETCKTLRIK